MSCSEARELITFWLAGTLGPEEADAVSRHVAGCDECRAAAAEGAALIAGLRELHLTTDEVVAAAAGDLNSPHVLVCPRCRDEVAVLRGINADLARRVSPAARARRQTVGLAAAAALIAAVPLLWFLTHGTGPARTSEPSTVAVAPAPRPPLKILVDKASLSALATETVRLRGVPGPRRIMLGDLAVALEPYRRDDFAEAAARLRPLREKYPAAPEIAYYLGICLLMLDRPAEAIAPLEMAERRMMPPGEAAFYLAVARVNAGQTAAGLTELTRLCGGGSDVAPRACAAAKQASAEPRR